MTTATAAHERANMPLRRGRPPTIAGAVPAADAAILGAGDVQLSGRHRVGRRVQARSETTGRRQAGRTRRSRQEGRARRQPRSRPSRSRRRAASSFRSSRKSLSPAERAMLERLPERRQELDARARELEMRETCCKAAEKRLEDKVDELKDVEAEIAAATPEEARRPSRALKSLVTMYENMKAKDAAKIFDRLDIKVADRGGDPDQSAPDVRHPGADVAGSRRAADRRTRQPRNAADKAQTPADLPKIEGRPSGLGGPDALRLTLR